MRERERTSREGGDSVALFGEARDKRGSNCSIVVHFVLLREIGQRTFSFQEINLRYQALQMLCVYLMDGRIKR